MCLELIGSECFVKGVLLAPATSASMATSRVLELRWVNTIGFAKIHSGLLFIWLFRFSPKRCAVGVRTMVHQVSLQPLPGQPPLKHVLQAKKLRNDRKAAFDALFSVPVSVHSTQSSELASRYLESNSAQWGVRIHPCRFLKSMGDLLSDFMDSRMIVAA
jgi:hypothetical protein